MKANTLAAAAAALLVVATAGAASAHHAFSMYDNVKYVALKGTITKYSWQNPHAMITFVADNGDSWSVECSSPNIIGRKGWTSTSLKAGDKVSMSVHQMKDGSKVALMVSVTTPSGQVLKDKD
jgi:hypothetical protein